MNSLFVGTFVNTAIMLFFTNANFEYSILSWIPLDNTDTDFGMKWYKGVAPQITFTMFMVAI
jgi:hypothetical protein